MGLTINMDKTKYRAVDVYQNYLYLQEGDYDFENVTELGNLRSNCSLQ